MTTAIVINQNDGKTRNVMTGGETTADFDFPIFAATHLNVYETDTSGTITLLVKDTDYTVPAGSVNQQAGGTINLDSTVYPSGATAGHVFTIFQAAPEARTSDFNQAGDFFADTLNQELDLVTQQIQQLRRDLNRAPLAPFDTTLTSLSIPDPEDGKLLSWNGTSGAIGNTAFGDISTAIDTLFVGLVSGDFLRYNGTNWVNVTEIVTADLADLAVTTAKLGATSVSTAKIATDAVTPAKIDTSVNAIGSVGGGTQDIDLDDGRSVTATIDTSTTTFTFSNPKATGNEDIFTLRLTNGGSQTINWPSSVDWIGGSAPSLTASGVDELTFKTVDGGTIWVGVAILDVK